jgi:hypothetical protein
VAEVALIGTVYDFVRAVQHHAFDGGGTHVKTDLQGLLLLQENDCVRLAGLQPQTIIFLGIIHAFDGICNHQSLEKL